MASVRAHLTIGLLALLPVLVGGPGTALAEVDWWTESYEGLEDQYIAVAPWRKIDQTGRAQPERLYFEAQLAPHFELFSAGSGCATWSLNPNEPAHCRGRNNVAVLLTPLTRLRMVGFDSSPVIPPSFMPALRVQFSQRRVYRKAPSSLTDPDARELRWGLMAGVHHHSNGQEGCAFLDETLPACAVPPNAPLAGLNELDGSFSTNYLSLSALFRYSWLTPDLHPRHSVIARFRYERHGNVNPGGLDPRLQRLWGNGHGAIAAEYRKGTCGVRDPDTRPDCLRVRAQVEAILSGTDPGRGRSFQDDLRSDIDVAWRPAFLPLALFARLSLGRDHYNILFTRSFNTLLLGIELLTGETVPLLRPEPDPL